MVEILVFGVEIERRLGLDTVEGRDVGEDTSGFVKVLIIVVKHSTLLMVKKNDEE